MFTSRGVTKPLAIAKTTNVADRLRHMRVAGQNTV